MPDRKYKYPTPMAPSALDSHEHASASTPSRFGLRVQAIIWRFLLAIGMFLHKLAPPRPSSPSFTRQIPTTVSRTSGEITLHFYLPESYHLDCRNANPTTKYPVVVNFHGGGFTIGAATDDARWATAVTQETGAVVVSVDYRLAPEHPFPTAVEDGVDAVLYVAKHAHELHLDRERIALSGFSAGGNLSFTVPMRLFEELESILNDAGPALDGPGEPAASKRGRSGHRTDSTLHDVLYATKVASQTKSQQLNLSSSSSTTTLLGSTTTSDTPVRLVAIVSFYPSTDYTLSRTARRLTCANPAAELSPAFTSLFDSSYLCPASTINYSSPFLSPVHAPTHLLRHGLPDHIVLHTCEWDMLAHEGRGLGEKLRSLGKDVVWREIKGVPHGWDKSPNPWKQAKGSCAVYTEACKDLKRIFSLEERDEDAGGLAKQTICGDVARN